MCYCSRLHYNVASSELFAVVAGVVCNMFVLSPCGILALAWLKVALITSQSVCVRRSKGHLNHRDEGSSTEYLNYIFPLIFDHSKLLR